MTFFLHTMGYIFWDPNRVFFTIPWIHHPIAWYGALFALGFIAGYFVVKNLFFNFLLERGETKESAKNTAVILADKLTFYSVIATVIGARVFHMFFYDFPILCQSPLEIFKVWEGGLSSHGAAVGLLISFWIFARREKKKYREMTTLFVLEMVLVSSLVAGFFIRLGNFVNQEILGKPTLLPFGVLFGHPFQPAPSVPLHPVQLYEALFYLLTALLLFLLVKKRLQRMGRGFYAGLFFILVFGFRFFIEFLKLPQSALYDENEFLSMGQLLSLPFFALGVYLLYFSLKKELYVIGGGDTAVEDSLFLTKYASKVYMVHRRDELRASKIMAMRAMNHPKIEILWSHVMTRIEGDSVVRRVTLKNVKTNQEHQREASGVFFAIGHTPNTAFLKGQLSLVGPGYILIKKPGTTISSVEGVFAAGDVQDPHYRQAVSAAGSGCMAAIDVERYLASKGL